MTSTSSFIPAPPILHIRDRSESSLRCRTPRMPSEGHKNAPDYNAWVALGLRDFLQTNKTAHGIARLRAGSKPVLHAFGIQLNLCGLLQWVIGPDQFHYAPIAWLAALNHHHAIKRL